MSRIMRNHTGHRMGEHHPKAKLTDQQVREMRLLRKRGWKYLALSIEFNCPESTVRDICTYRTRPA